MPQRRPTGPQALSRVASRVEGKILGAVAGEQKYQIFEGHGVAFLQDGKQKLALIVAHSGSLDNATFAATRFNGGLLTERATHVVSGCPGGLYGYFRDIR